MAKGSEQFCDQQSKRRYTYRADEALLVPFGPQRIDRDFWYWLSTRFALRLVKPDMASLAVRMTLVYDKRVGLANIVLLSAFGPRRRRLGRVEKRVAAFGAEEVQLVVISLAEHVVVERDEAVLDDGGLAVKAVVGEFLGVSGKPLLARTSIALTS